MRPTDCLKAENAVQPEEKPLIVRVSSLALLAMLLGIGLSLALMAAAAPAGPNANHIAAVWANEGGDKVTRDELRATVDPAAVLNSAWDGTTIRLFGARNEVVGFNLVLEAPASATGQIEVRLDRLDGPAGASITTTQATSATLFNYVGRNIELFFVRYLEIEGLSRLAYESYDERHIPEDCRLPHDESGIGTGGWTDRPCHNRLYPDIAVPLELHTPFTIPAGTNQSIWGDIYVPKETPAGIYSGEIEISEEGAVTGRIPISLTVRNFTLPDLPSAKTMLFINWGDINQRYLGSEHMWPEPGTAVYTQALMVSNRHAQLAHRHKISVIDDYTEIERLSDAWMDRLSGELFTAAQGYDGIGVGVGNNVYSIGTYGGWPWQEGSQADMWSNSNAWVDWFESQDFATPVEYFLYLVDESDDFPQIEQWAQWLEDNPGSGQRLKSLATLRLPDATAHTPSLDIPASGPMAAITADWDAALAALRTDPEKRFFMYNGQRPFSGSLATEDEGVAPRELGWSQFKQGIDRWFIWESTYYTNFQCYGYHDPRAFTNVFRQAQTFGCYHTDDPMRGKSGWNYNNGDGVLFYPGTDTLYPADSYGVAGPIASLRLKLWRRGIQDVDYLTLAAASDPTATLQIVETMVPTVTWEYGVADPGDPTWIRSDISWSIDPDDWEAARLALADIIEKEPAPADFNGNGCVDAGDIIIIADLWGAASSDPRFDRDGDGRVTVVDVMQVAALWDSGCQSPEPGSGPTIAGCPLQPTDNIWNMPVDELPLDANSATYINTIGASAGLHPDFGSGLWNGGPIGIPWIDVPGSQPRVPISFDYDEESDPGPYPIPPDAPIEGGPDSDGDRHVLVVDRDNCLLYEVYNAWPQPDGSWQAGSGAIFDLNDNTLRPETWTSADAAGLPILPGLVRYEEVAAGEIKHALRFTAPQTRRAYVWPARHFASTLTGSQYPPMGQRFRLKASFDISGFSPEVQVILQALKTYGMILADNGSRWYISGAPDERWNNDVLRELRQVTGANFEAVDVSSLMINPDSGQARQ